MSSLSKAVSCLVITGCSVAFMMRVLAAMATTIFMSFAMINMAEATPPRVDAGSAHSLALTSNGLVAAWGNNTFGQSTVPPGLNNIVAVSAGAQHSLALKSDGMVVAWGGNTHGQSTVPSWLSGVVAISAGGLHSLALRNDGTVVAWGYNGYGQLNVPTGLNGVTAISAGARYSLALKSDGTVVAWGYNGNGQFNVPSGFPVTAISASNYHSLALKSDGTVVAWGTHPSLGALTVPAGLNSVVGIACGDDRCYALRSNGTVVMWDHSNKVWEGGTNIVAISSGYGHSPLSGYGDSLLLQSDGLVYVERGMSAPAGLNLGATPLAFTNPATLIAKTGATLNGAVNTGGSSTAVVFQYGATISYGSTVTATQNPVTSTTNTAVLAPVSGLACGTTYHFRIVATGPNATTHGLDRTFNTLPCSPTAQTGAAISVTPTGATLTGTVNANGASTTVTFQYGTTTVYGATVTATQNPVTGRNFTYVSAPVSGLTCGTTYHFRVVGVNAGGTTKGADTTFTPSCLGIPLGTALNNTSLNWTTGGNAGWSGQAGVSHDGVASAQSGGITHNQTSSLGAVIVGPGTLTFWAKVDSETLRDYLRFYIDGVEQPGALSGSWGPTTWVQKTFSIAAGSHTFEWRYTKDGAFSFGADTAWVDEVVYTPTPTPPTVVTGLAKSISSTGATLTGRVTANNASTTVRFQYGATAFYGSTVTAVPSPVTGSTSTPVSGPITGLTCGTLYHFRAVGVNSSGTTNGFDSTFTTNPCSYTVNATAGAGGAVTPTSRSVNHGATVSFTVTPNTGFTKNSTVTGTCPTGSWSGNTYTTGAITRACSVRFSFFGAPTITPGVASSITQTGATLNASVNPNNVSTTVTFQYGTTTAYGSSVSGGTLAGGATQAVSAPVTGLTCGRTYHFRAVAVNSAGTTNGADATFDTSACLLAPTVTTGSATSVTYTGATFNASVNPNNASTTVTFQYGTTTAYGSSASGGTLAGSTNQAVSTPVTGLACGTTYHFRAVGGSSSGVTNGLDGVFKTTPCPASDFDGDGKSDILWRNAGNGNTRVWAMDGLTMATNTLTSQLAGVYTPIAGLHVHGVADFDGDGKKDVLWRNAGTGQLTVWKMNGATVVTSLLVATNPGLYTATTGLQARGVGDFDGDGKADILWGDAGSGAASIWFMNGAVISRTAPLANQTGLVWQVHGIGDFNGDGKSDILWRNTVTGGAYIWFMNGETVASYGATSVLAGVYTSTTGLHVQGVGDFNGDGKSDILWRNAGTGAASVWLMNGTTASSAPTSVQPGAYTATTGSQVHGLGDFNGDGKSDILFRNAGTGATSIWLMNGATVAIQGNTSAQVGPYTASTGFHIMSEETIR